VSRIWLNTWLFFYFIYHVPTDFTPHQFFPRPPVHCALLGTGIDWGEWGDGGIIDIGFNTAVLGVCLPFGSLHAFLTAGHLASIKDFRDAFDMVLHSMLDIVRVQMTSKPVHHDKIRSRSTHEQLESSSYEGYEMGMLYSTRFYPPTTKKTEQTQAPEADVMVDTKTDYLTTSFHICPYFHTLLTVSSQSSICDSPNRGNVDSDKPGGWNTGR